MALQTVTSFLPSALSARKEGAVKDSVFLGVRLSYGLKLDTASLEVHTKDLHSRLHAQASAPSMSGCCCSCARSMPKIQQPEMQLDDLWADLLMAE